MVLNKPAGLAVQGGSGITRNVDDMLEVMRDAKGQKPRLVHRLDRETSGCLLIAKTRFAATALTGSFRHRSARKIYWALVAGVPKPKQGRISTYLAKEESEDDTIMVIAKHGDEGASHAVTYYAVVETSAQKLAWVSLKPVTGRTHQLRAHMAHIDHRHRRRSQIFQQGKLAIAGRPAEAAASAGAADRDPASARRRDRRVGAAAAAHAAVLEPARPRSRPVRSDRERARGMTGVAASMRRWPMRSEQSKNYQSEVARIGYRPVRLLQLCGPGPACKRLSHMIGNWLAPRFSSYCLARRRSSASPPTRRPSRWWAAGSTHRRTQPRCWMPSFVVSDGVITAVGKRSEVQLPQDARVIDCAGKTIVAGFWNSHVHFTQAVWKNAASAPAASLDSTHAGDADAVGLHDRVGSWLRPEPTLWRCAAASSRVKSPAPISSLPAASSPRMVIPFICRPKLQLPEAATPEEAARDGAQAYWTWALTA